MNSNVEKKDLDNELKRDMDRISLLQYANLRKYFNENLIIPILGEHYYNMGMDVYKCDQNTTEDLRYTFEKLKEDIIVYKVLLALSLAASICFFIALIFS